MMKKFLKGILCLPIFICAVVFCTIFTSCGDDKDEPDVSGTTNVITNFGVVTSTGFKSKSLFASAHDGDNVLNIPGFAPIRLATDYNIYQHINTGAHLYADDLGNDFAEWEPGNDIPDKFEEESWGSYILVRTRVKNSDNYVYAYIEKDRYLKESTGGMQGNVIGAVLKYISPIDPLTFKGFSENN